MSLNPTPQDSSTETPESPKFNLTPREARAKWREALRSDQYKQTKGTLARKLVTKTEEGETTDVAYCCLGLATLLFGQLEPEHNMKLVDTAHGMAFCDDNSDRYQHCTSLPAIVRKWLGLEGAFGSCSYDVSAPYLQNTAYLVPGVGQDGKKYTSLSSLNDGAQYTFKEIADFLEKSEELDNGLIVVK